MEQILVGMDGRHGAWEALSRACALTRRMNAHLHVLLVQSPPGDAVLPGVLRQDADLRKHLQLRIESAKAQGVPVDYYIAQGRYEDEIVRFVNDYRITLLVYELRQGGLESAKKGSRPLQAIRRRIACKVEIVVPRKNIFQPQERTV